MQRREKKRLTCVNLSIRVKKTMSSPTTFQPEPIDSWDSPRASRAVLWIRFLKLILTLAACTGLLAAAAGLLGSPAMPMLIVSGVASVVALLALTLLVIFRAILTRDAYRELLESKEDLRTLVESAMDAIIAMDEVHTVILFNDAAEKLFGRTRDSVIGNKLDMLLPQRFRGAHGAHVARFGKTGVTNRRMGDNTVLLALRANDEEFPIEASISQHGEANSKTYTVILRDITERVEAECALRRSREVVRELAANSQSAREQEKARVARELHDEIGGALTALKMDTAWVSERLPAAETGLAEKLSVMRQTLDHTVAATRRISSNLRPMMLDDLGLVPAVEWLVHDFERYSGITCELAISLPEIAMPDDHATAVFRLLQESLTNIAKHAKASHAEIAMDMEDGRLNLTIRDNGVGFDPAAPRGSQSFGLLGIRERLYLLSGEVRIESSPGNGCVIEIQIPLSGKQGKS